MTSKGKLVVYYGCMFSGKTSALIQYISDLGLKNNELIVMKPSVDVRSGQANIKTHDGKIHPCVIYEKDIEITSYVDQYTKVLALDEVQFFDKMFLSEIKRLLGKGISVVASGLDKDYLNRPFGLMPALLDLADEKHHLKAKCEVCGADAEHSFRKAQNNVLILIGQSDYYEARCSNCFNKKD
jgi:thymidine kinase